MPSGGQRQASRAANVPSWEQLCGMTAAKLLETVLVAYRSNQHLKQLCAAVKAGKPALKDVAGLADGADNNAKIVSILESVHDVSSAAGSNAAPTMGQALSEIKRVAIAVETQSAAVQQLSARVDSLFGGGAPAPVAAGSDSSPPAASASSVPTAGGGRSYSDVVLGGVAKEVHRVFAERDRQERNACTLVVLGLPEAQDMHEDTLLNVQTLLTNKMQLAPAAVSLVSAERVGSMRDDGTPRTVVVQCASKKDRDVVLLRGNKRKLQGSRIGIDRYRTSAEMGEHRARVREMKQAREQGKIAYFNGDELVIHSARSRQPPVSPVGSPPRGSSQGSGLAQQQDTEPAAGVEAAANKRVRGDLSPQREGPVEDVTSGPAPHKRQCGSQVDAEAGASAPAPMDTSALTSDAQNSALPPPAADPQILPSPP